MSRIKGSASATILASMMMRSPMARMFGSKVCTSYSMTVLPVLFIWSMASSIAVDKALMSDRSNGVMKLRRIAWITS